jgi:PBSX family phage terminase large subunit
VTKVRTAEQAAAVLEETRRRRLAKSDLLESAFKQQRSFIEDPSKLKAALCTRRAGKTYGIGLYIFKEAIQNPGCSILYLGLSYQSAKRIVMKDIFQVIAKKFGLNVKFNWSDLSMQFPNGSVVYISGADANEKQHSKLLGQKYRLAVIDEAAEWKTDLINLVYSTLKPAMIDYGGTIAMVGVPGNIQGFFYEVTDHMVDKLTGKLQWPGWKVHRWNAFDNPHIADNWEKEIEELKERNPLFLNTPIFKQQYLGQWVVDPDALCYKFDVKQNIIEELPYPANQYDYVLGVDLGWNDPTAFVVCAYREDESKLYVVHASKQKHMLPNDIAEKVKLLEEEFKINKWIIDGANLQLVSDLRVRLGIPFEAAIKGTSLNRKRDYIHLASSDLVQRNILVLNKGCDDLITEWKKLVWDKTDKYNPMEHKACDNHCADAFLYAYNACYAFVAKLATNPEPLRNTPEWVSKLEENLVKRLSKKHDDLAALDGLLDDRE